MKINTLVRWLWITLGIGLAPVAPAEAQGPVDTWYTVPALKPTDPETKRAGKHIRIAWDGKRGRFVVAGGDRDGSDIGQPSVKALDPETGQTTVLSPTCPPETDYMPHFPDNVGWVYDSKRDEFLMFRGFYGHSYRVAEKVCKRTDDKVLKTDVLFDPQTNLWAPHPWPVSPLGYGSDGAGPTHAVYAALTDKVYLFKNHGGWGALLLVLGREDNSWQAVKLGGGQRSGVRGAVCYRSGPAILDGWLYCISSRGKNSALLRVSLKDPSSAETFPMPEGFTGTPDDAENWLVAHPTANVLLYPYFRGLTGPMLALHVWNPRTKAWDTRPPPVPPDVKEQVTGGSATFNPLTGELVMCCRALRGFEGYLTWRYRYGKPN